MIPLSLETLSQHLGTFRVGDDVTIQDLSSDSRKIGAATLFVALKGERFDGHDFAATAIENGAAALMVERELAFDIPQLIVPDCQKAMGAIGAYVRDQINPICVALTGSNGKTSVKEMIATILSAKHQILYTAGNFNNEIGVPLTLLRLTPADEFGIFELGANHKGEIDYTSGLVRPNVALVNNVGSAHLEGFGSQAGVAQAKSEIFNHLQADGTAIINADDAFADFMSVKARPYKQLSFSQQDGAAKRHIDVIATGHKTNADGCYRFMLNYLGESCQVVLPLAGRHQVSNALAAASVCIALGLSLTEISEGLSQLTPVKGRMQPSQLGRVRLIDDSYNANPVSVGAAIAWLKEISENRCLVLGDLGELGDNAPLLHAELGQLAKQQGIDALFCTGTLSQHTSQAFGAEHYDSVATLVEELIKHINQLPGQVTVLVKGSRSAAMERVVDGLTVAFGRGELV
ncbi:UDP-N-acetylmuramoyl-tripeptide--D-alanyl-D-alanine ligase [Shewanella sp. SW36]|uniref:UDP-N-acetylmuramoyl-tripeptide--D-alanyl-D- alanine ligase n=1 Tax=unclassified Shewanella TaxID=196818 RepID=UPI0021DAAE53|nr:MULTISPECIES: UDP-N-acetylmuramoyl-tripeptide--D-alanyl-D-alanine ligase [unclassified Shewanella]MCU7975799.1 UDP-N-acetylmuramoyl-tripeptide--D-alanyl-D-alanine ligase [Shewanella sp. SW36]MCU7991188.1 UDP-N-acetylmuramoyl-tripeptide--D-alanyl-D-alanine ligase [Shewanella sp. SW1]MCU8052281.1 UDP-N-acetylmuramoyl-tripeptide--D-alanyl-D-alanine ligase [Shewanella sp. SM43]